MELLKTMSSQNQRNRMPEKIVVLLAVMGLVIILAAKEWFTIYVIDLADHFNLTVGDMWLIIIVVTAFLVVFITWFFQSIRVEKR